MREKKMSLSKTRQCIDSKVTEKNRLRSVHSCVRRVFAKLFLSADVRYEVLAVKGQYYVWLSLKSNEHWSFTSSVLCSSFNSTLPSLNASAVSGMLDFVSP